MLQQITTHTVKEAKRRPRLPLLVALTAVLPFAGQAASIYVDVTNAGGTGGTQADPYPSIRTALGTASGSDSIYVADGAYNDSVENFSASGRFAVTSNLKFYGGYLGLTGGSTYDWSEGSRVSRGSIIDAESNSQIFYLNASAPPSIDGFTLQNGFSASDGGAIETYGDFGTGGADIDNVLFKDNTANGNGGAMAVHANYEDVTIDDCDFEGNSAANGGALKTSGNNGSAAIRNTTFTGNSATNNGGVLTFSGGCPLTIEDSSMTGNSATSQGGAIGGAGTNVDIRRTFITENSAGTTSAIYTRSFATTDMLLENVVIADNESTGGSGYAIEMGSNGGGSLTVQFSTLANNTGAGGIYLNSKGTANETLTVENAILDGDGTGTGIRVKSTPTVNLDYNDVYDFATLYNGASAGSNSISADPRFAAPLGGDYSILASSPARSAGTDIGIYEDILGQERLVGYIDMGAYEIPEPSSLGLLALGLVAFCCRSPIKRAA